MQAELERAYAVCMRHRSVATDPSGLSAWEDACAGATEHFSTLLLSLATTADDATLASTTLPVFVKCLHEVRVGNAWVACDIVGFHRPSRKGAVPTYIVAYPDPNQVAGRYPNGSAIANIVKRENILADDEERLRSTDTFAEPKVYRTHKKYKETGKKILYEPSEEQRDGLIVAAVRARAWKAAATLAARPSPKPEGQADKALGFLLLLNTIMTGMSGDPVVAPAAVVSDKKEGRWYPRVDAAPVLELAAARTACLRRHGLLDNVMARWCVIDVAARWAACDARDRGSDAGLKRGGARRRAAVQDLLRAAMVASPADASAADAGANDASQLCVRLGERVWDACAQALARRYRDGTARSHGGMHRGPPLSYLAQSAVATCGFAWRLDWATPPCWDVLILGPVLCEWTANQFRLSAVLRKAKSGREAMDSALRKIGEAVAFTVHAGMLASRTGRPASNRWQQQVDRVPTRAALVKSAVAALRAVHARAFSEGPGPWAKSFVFDDGADADASSAMSESVFMRATAEHARKAATARKELPAAAPACEAVFRLLGDHHQHQASTGTNSDGTALDFLEAYAVELLTASPAAARTPPSVLLRLATEAKFSAGCVAVFEARLERQPGGYSFPMRAHDFMPQLAPCLRCFVPFEAAEKMVGCATAGGGCGGGGGGGGRAHGPDVIGAWAECLSAHYRGHPGLAEALFARHAQTIAADTAAVGRLLDVCRYDYETSHSSYAKGKSSRTVASPAVDPDTAARWLALAARCGASAARRLAAAKQAAEARPSANNELVRAARAAARLAALFVRRQFGPGLAPLPPGAWVRQELLANLWPLDRRSTHPAEWDPESPAQMSASDGMWKHAPPPPPSGPHGAATEGPRRWFGDLPVIRRWQREAMRIRFGDSPSYRGHLLTWALLCDDTRFYDRDDEGEGGGGDGGREGGGGGGDTNDGIGVHCRLVLELMGDGRVDGEEGALVWLAAITRHPWHPGRKYPTLEGGARPVDMQKPAREHLNELFGKFAVPGTHAAIGGKGAAKWWASQERRLKALALDNPLHPRAEARARWLLRHGLVEGVAGASSTLGAWLAAAVAAHVRGFPRREATAERGFLAQAIAPGDAALRRTLARGRDRGVALLALLLAHGATVPEGARDDNAAAGAVALLEACAIAERACEARRATAEAILGDRFGLPSDVIGDIDSYLPAFKASSLKGRCAEVHSREGELADQDAAFQRRWRELNPQKCMLGRRCVVS